LKKRKREHEALRTRLVLKTFYPIIIVPFYVVQLGDNHQKKDSAKIHQYWKNQPREVITRRSCKHIQFRWYKLEITLFDRTPNPEFSMATEIRF
jgi:hypothetical protein